MTEDGRQIIDLCRNEIKRRGWSRSARMTGIDRTALHRAFNPSRQHTPSFKTIMAVARALDIKLIAEVR
jgi:DNA-binding phage protein